MKSTNIIIGIVIVLFLVWFFKPEVFFSVGMGGAENFDGNHGACVSQGGQCGPLGYPYANQNVDVPKQDNFSSCYQQKQIYLNSTDPDEVSAHGDVHLEQRWGKLYITLNCNLPYAKGGVFNTMWGAYHAFLVDTKNNKSLNIGSLVRHGDRFYKLSTELLGDYSNYDQIWVYIQTEDYAPKLKLKGSIRSQQCSSL